MTLNTNIRSLRLQKSLSQEALGEQLGVTAQAVSKWEQGITSPDISLLPHLAACFGVTIDCLFSKAEMFASIGQKDQAISQYEEILAWLESHGYNMDLEGVYPRQRIREIQES